DIILALTTPPLISLLALLVARARGARMIVLMQDVYPDVAVAVGTLKKNSLVARLLERLSALALRRADRIIVLGECMRERVRAKLGGAAARPPVDVIPNWADGEQIKPLDPNSENPFAARHDLEDKFAVLFSGNFGLVNEFATVLRAAEILGDRADVQFVFVGDGAKHAEIESFVRQRGLGNVLVLPYQPREFVRYSLAAGDALLVTLADGLAGLSVPSKTYAIMAAGRPVLYVGDAKSDVARLITRSGCGTVVAAGDARGLADVITDWAANKLRTEEMGRTARRTFERYFERAHAADAYLRSFIEAMKEEPRRPLSLLRRAQD
ncbi:MAG: glycosyltransferase family 4 protein, partial [Acidobacteriota bacterium]|nr:glycosyltransferase family 4 protein [Acidobacteriota bacterium]